MLQAEHIGHRYPKPLFTPHNERPRSHVRLFARVSPVIHLEARRPLVAWGDAEEFTLGEIARYSDKRTELALRKLRGESLTVREQLILSVLNTLTRLVVTPPTRLSGEVREAMDEYRTWQATRRSRDAG
jgi:hypothetical protein